jgi:MOSC domain-containing protein YiiM
MQGSVVDIYTATEGGAAMQAQSQVHVIAGKGIEGDRYAAQTGAFSKPDEPNQQITLIEREAIEGACQQYDMELSAAEMRRNVVTENVALNHLVDREFTVGAARLRGLKLCEPCGYLTKMLGKDVVKAMKHRGGLRCEVLQGGAIAVGDAVIAD